jgi:hypothetical protein
MRAAPLATPLLVTAVATTSAHLTTFQPPMLITPPHSFVDGKEVNWLTGYADGGARLDDDNLLWQTTLGMANAEKYGAPVYRSTDKGSSWQRVYVPKQQFITTPVPDPTAVGMGQHALRGWGQLAADPCSPNGTSPPNDLNQTWSRLTSDVCWQMPCDPPLSFGEEETASSSSVSVSVEFSPCVCPEPALANRRVSYDKTSENCRIVQVPTPPLEASALPTTLVDRSPSTSRATKSGATIRPCTQRQSCQSAVRSR